MKSLVTRTLPSALGAACAQVPAIAGWPLTPSAHALAVGLESVRGETALQARQIQLQGQRLLVQGTNGFVVKDYPTGADKPVGGVRGIPPRGRPV